MKRNSEYEKYYNPAYAQQGENVDLTGGDYEAEDSHPFSIRVGGEGSIYVKFIGGDDWILYENFSGWLPAFLVAVRKTGTTCTNIVAHV